VRELLAVFFQEAVDAETLDQEFDA